MFGLGDYVLHKQTGEFGKVVGYGHEILNGVYMTTLKVLVSDTSDRDKKKGFVEDLYSRWTQWVN